MLIAYPADLPGPTPGSFAPRPRRAAAAIDGVLQQRARQRDAAGLTSQYTYVYTPEQVAAWRDWYRDTLLDGRRWFAHALPGRSGVVPRVVRYLEVQQQQLGAGIYRVLARFEQRGASVDPRDDGDPHFGLVLMLLHPSVGNIPGSDVSSYGRLMVASGAATIDDEVTLFGEPTFKLAGASDYISSNPAFLSALGGVQEWCIETHAYITGAGTSAIVLAGQFGLAWTTDNRVIGSANINFGTITVGAPNGSVPLTAWRHIAFVRDRSAVDYDYLKLYVAGTLAGTSAGFAKTADTIPGEGFDEFVGGPGTSIAGRYSNLRITAGAARYYADFTPPAAPFPAF